jgi:integrase/recombinase XerC
VRLAKDKRGIWYVWFDRSTCRSLRTRDYDEARTLYGETRRKWLRGKLHLLEHGPHISLKDFTKEYLKTRKGIASSTVRSDSLALRKLELFAGNLSDLRKITPHLLASWVADMRKTVKSPASRNTYQRTLRAALGVAKEWMYLEEVPSFRFETEEEKIPRLVDVGKVEDIQDPYLKRMAIFYAWTGCRRSEGHNAKWGDIVGDMIRIRGKRGKERMVPLLPIVKEALGPAGKPTERIFPKWAHPDTVSHKIKEAIGSRAHDLRHTTASMLVMGGADLNAVMTILGHADLKTTERYLHTTEAHLMEAMNRLQAARQPRGVVVQLSEKKEDVCGSSPPVGSSTYSVSDHLYHHSIVRERPSKAKMPRMVRGVGKAPSCSSTSGH